MMIWQECLSVFESDTCKVHTWRKTVCEIKQIVYELCPLIYPARSWEVKKSLLEEEKIYSMSLSFSMCYYGYELWNCVFYSKDVL